MNIEQIAYFRSSFPTKFGIPRQSGLVDELCGQIVFEPRFRNSDALRGLEGFDYLWIIWGFSANIREENSIIGRWSPTVRPPLLGGNKTMGVFATRSPFRPNSLGLSSVRIERIETTAAEGVVIHVRGGDLMDGTPIYDIKPYLAYCDAHPDARSGFVDEKEWPGLSVELPDYLSRMLPAHKRRALVNVLSLDPRPKYHNDASKIYGMPFEGYDVRFTVDGDTLTVQDIVKL